MLNIDLSPSYDDDSSQEDLRFMVEEYGPIDWQASSMIQLEFFSAEAEKKEFTVEVKVRDKKGWENDKLEIVTDENTVNAAVERFIKKELVNRIDKLH